MTFSIFDHEIMAFALRIAKKGAMLGEVPVGAVCVVDKKIIAYAHNEVETRQDASAHAELLALQNAAKALNNWRLTNVTLYTTLEPCLMCGGSMFLFRVSRIIWGAKDLRHGSHGSIANLFNNKHPIHQPEIAGGLLEEEASTLIQKFFKEQRKRKKDGPKTSRPIS